jgi:hypothetical protein
MKEVADFFVAGGTLRPQSPSYVVRPADQELFDCIKTGEFCYVLTSRQMGKSSLMVQTAQRLQNARYVTVVLDLTSIGTGSVAEWYQGLLERIKRDLRLTVDVRSWWQEQSALSISHRFTAFLHDVVLQQIPDPVVIFIDEIDATLNLAFRDDFFAAIRAVYNARAVSLAYNRLTFVLLGVATPTDLISDRKRTPFNIGRRIVLQELDYVDADMLRDGLELYHPGQGAAILERIFYWTNGHPYLTQKLCLATIDHPLQEWNAARVDELVETTFLLDEGRNDTNIKFVQKSIQDSTLNERRRMLKLYVQVYNGKSIPDDHRSRSQNYLELYGLIRVANGMLRVRNEIYRHIFNPAWVKNNIPRNRERSVAIFSSLLATIMIVLAIFFSITRTPADRRAQECEQTFNQTVSKTERLSALVCLFDLDAPQYDERALRLFYTLPPDTQYYFFLDIPGEQDRALAVVVENIFRTLPDTARSESNGIDHDEKILDGMSAGIKSVSQISSDLKEQIAALRAGRRLAAAGEYAGAIEYYNQVLASRSEHPAARYDRAMAYMELGRYSESLADLNHMLEIATTQHTPTVTVTPSLTSTSAPGSTTPTATDMTTGSSATPTVTATTTLTTTSVVGTVLFVEYDKFLNAAQIRRTVAEVINANPPLRNHLRETLAQGAYPHLAAMSDRLEIALVRTPTSDAPQMTGTPPASPEAISIVSIDPTVVFTGTLPIVFTVRGANLDQVQNAQLVADDRTAIQLIVESDAPGEALLTLTELPEALNGGVAYKLQINGENYSEFQLRDYIEVREVKGVNIEYRYTGRVADDETGPFTAMREVRDVASDRIGILRTGDLVDILWDEGDGWYRVRIRESSDPDEIGKVGWIERWLVDDNAEVPTPLPPTATPSQTAVPPPTSSVQPTSTPQPIPTSFAQPPQPQVRYFNAAPLVSYAGSGDSGRFESCVTGSVTGSEGPIVGAVVNVNNGPNSFDATTGGGGNFRVCGLGASNWTAVLYFVPGTPIGNQPAVTVYVNGLPEQHAVVSFTQR